MFEHDGVLHHRSALLLGTHQIGIEDSRNRLQAHRREGEREREVMWKPLSLGS